MIASLWLLVFALAFRAYLFFDPNAPQHILGFVLNQSPHFQNDPVFGWVPVPNLNQGSLDPDWSGWHHFETDSNGFRSPQPAESFEGQRLVLLGDSMAWGVGVGQNTVAGTVLRDRLGPGHEVLVVAAAGWSIDQEYYFFEQRVLPLAPDVVFWLVTPVNDIYQVLHAQSASGVVNPKPRFRLEADGRLVLEPIDPSAPLPEIGESLAANRSLLNLFYAHPDSEYERALRLSAALLKSGTERWSAHGSRVFVVMFQPYVLGPGYTSFTDLAEKLGHNPGDFSTERATANMATIARVAGVDVYLFDTKRDMMFRKDSHLNETGHRALAAFLSGILHGEVQPLWRAE